MIYFRIGYLVPASIRAKNTAEGVPVMPLFSKAAAMQSPRLIRPHLPMYLLHPTLLANTAKVSRLRNKAIYVSIYIIYIWQVVYVARNPKDVIVSFYHHHRLIKYHGCDTDIETFADYFMRDLGSLYIYIFFFNICI